MRPGNRVGDVSATIQQFVEGYSYHVPREYTGHGVGRAMHEGPLVPNFGVSGSRHTIATRDHGCHRTDGDGWHPPDKGA